MERVEIVIRGRVNSGKTAMQTHIARLLSASGFDVAIDWGTDGDPARTTETQDKIVQELKSKIELTIITENIPTLKKD
jgi:hypothetical protein